MKKQKAAVLDSSLLVRKGAAKPSVFSAADPVNADPAHRGWPVEHPVEHEAPAAGSEMTGDSPVPLPQDTASPQDAASAGKADTAADTAAAMERIRNAMAGGSTIPFPGRDVAANDLVDFAAVKTAFAEGSLARGKAAVRWFASRRKPRAKKRVATTLRLDPERHLRLKIFTAWTERSIQDVLTCALDDYLDRASAVGRDHAGLGARPEPGTQCGGKE